MNTQTVRAGIALALLGACATEPRLPSIQNAEAVSIRVTRTEKPDALIAIRNEAIGTSVNAGGSAGHSSTGRWIQRRPPASSAS